MICYFDEMVFRIIGGTMTKTLQTGSQGRLNLGKKYASSTFTVEVVDDEGFLLKKTAVIPERELWLLKDSKTYESIHRGMKDAKEKRLTKLDSKEFDV
ncbi:hypothetical protein [Simkania negevensis]|uniref:Uncharacterized protein n=1 Tax=Simkania negevensis (strain ATCC VR-1471 / DSM 27360 / Z) TaxID=331113 RepID=F8L8S6_SIMNZ|nr:hypothetical protein [Simkania negevensis]CCB89219.1 unknown protein [Simkania negevensis Z]